jgi:molybdopterin synthase sulfur carrier subunit
MKVRVKFFTSLREITGKKEEEIQSPRTIRVKELLASLSEKYGREFTDYLYDERGKVRTYIQILVNGRGINVLQGFETELEEGDTIAIFPPVGGG